MLRGIKRAVFAALGPDTFLTLSAVWNINRNYEPSFRRFLQLIPQEGTLLDVGANLGITLAMAKRERPDLRLIALEPIPRNLKILRRVQSLYAIRNLQIFAVAAGDQEARVEMQVPMTNGLMDTARSRIVPEQSRSAEQRDSAVFQTIEVNLRPLDAFHFERVDAIKVDVEGHEYQVFCGARDLLLAHRPLVFCEIWSTSGPQRTMELMRSLRYSSMPLGDENFLFFPDEKAEELAIRSQSGAKEPERKSAA